MSLLYNRLRELIINGQLNDIEEFFQSHPLYTIDINLVYLATECNQEEIVKLLISHGDPTKSNREIISSSSAVRYGICKELLKNGIHINCVNSQENCDFVNESVVKILENYFPSIVDNSTGDDDNVENKSQINGTDDEGLLCQSIRLLGHQMVDVLLENGADFTALTEKNQTVLHFAAGHYNNPEAFTRLLDFYNDDPYPIDSDNCIPLYLAVMKQNLITTEILLNRNPNIFDRRNKMAFCLAILANNDNKEKNMKLVHLFIGRGFTIQHSDFTNLEIPEPWHQHLSAIQNDREYQDLPYLLHRELSMELLFEFFILKASITHDFFGIFLNLMGPHVNVDIHFPKLGSLLHIACEFNRDKIVNYLIKRGADVNCRNSQYMRPIHYAVRGNHGKIVEQLLSARANIEYRNSIGESPLFMVFSCSSFDCLDLLLDAGSDVNCHDYLQRYPLHLAAEFEHEIYVKLLLKYQANVNVRDSNNDTPLDIILQRGRKRNFRIAKILLNHGAFYEIHQQTIELNDFHDYLLMHKIKTDLIGWGCIVGNLENVATLTEMRIFSQNCRDEIKRMKMIHLGKNITLFNVLTASHDQIANYMKERNFLDQYKKIDFKIFPIYEDLMDTRFMKGLRKYDINNLASYCINVLFNNNMPTSVREIVFNCMSDLDLRRFIIVSPICKTRKLAIMERGNRVLDIIPEQHVNYLH